MLPQGTIPRGEAFFDPVLKGKTGAARLAADDRCPGRPDRPVGHREGVAPVGQGAHRDQPAAPAAGDRDGSGHRSRSAATTRWPTRRPLMDAIVDLLPDEAREPARPTDEELAATRPPA